MIFVFSNVSLLPLQVYNEVVCNCHEDSKLLDVIALVESVYQADTQRERVKYGRRLQKAIKIFLHDFTHHMEEEEAIFQPLLVENFDSKELKDMKEIVQKQHSLFRERVKSEKSLKALKRKRSQEVDKSADLDFNLEDLRFKKSYCQEVNDFLRKKGHEDDDASPSSSDTKAIDEFFDHDSVVASKKSKLTICSYEKKGDQQQQQKQQQPSSSRGEQHKSSALTPYNLTGFKEGVAGSLSTATPTTAGDSNISSSYPATIEDLPEELLVVIFSHLNPKELLASGAINHRWRKVAFSSVFWKAMYPTQWARGQWSFDYIPVDLKADDDLLTMR